MTKEQIIKEIKLSPDFKGMQLSNITAVLIKMMIIEGVNVTVLADFLNEMMPANSQLLRKALTEIQSQPRTGGKDAK